MKKTILLAACLAAAVLLWAVLARGGRRPNVVLVSIDTLRADRLGCYGYGKETSPFLDRLAREGTLFEDAIVQSHWTLPSHVSMLTSLHATTHRVRGDTDKMGEAFLTMAEILRDAGYDTAAFVDGGLISAQFGFGQGFDVFDSRRGGDKDRRTLRWVLKKRRRPFFLFYHTYDVHFPYLHHPQPVDIMADPALADIARRINSRRFDLSDEEFEKAVLAWCTTREFHQMVTRDKLVPLKAEMETFFKDRWPRMPSFRESLRYLVDAYDGGIRFFDGRLERMWEEVGKLGMHDHTILIVTSDHGECFLEHGELGHPPVLYDEILRVPLIIVYPPLVGKGVRVPRQVMSIDILPTVLEMLGVPRPPHFQGRSFLDALRGGSLPPAPAFADAVVSEAVRDDGWKLIRSGEDAPEPRGPELYRLVDDPLERTNMVGRDTAVHARLDAILDGWRADNRRAREALGVALSPEKAHLDQEIKDQLRALGYLQ
ncbi:MAG: sulfatase [bacterium]|nr:sulfatase [bacterium]